jgi:hypothetical protein
MKNKILTYTSALALATGLFTSCKKERLELDPYNQLPVDQAFVTQNDFTNAIRGMYKGFVTSGSYTGGEWIVLGDLVADNLIRNSTGRGTGANYYLWQYTAEATSGLFGNGYNIIRRANGIITNINNLPDGAFKNNAEAEARAVRALVHFDMARVYSKIYANSDPNTDLGMPYLTGIDFSLKPARPVLKVTYDSIVNDLTLAYAKINLLNKEQTFETMRLNRAAVAGLLSRVYLHMADWANTTKWADSSLKYNSNLGTLTTFKDIWVDDKEEGVLFKIRMTEKDNITIGVQYEQLTNNEYRSEFAPVYELFTQYAANDVRKAAYFLTGNYINTPYNHVIKYARRLSGRLNIVDCKVLRTAEVLLSRAEAKYKNANPVGALADLNTLMASRYTGFVNLNLTGQALLDEIYKQRRLELFGEGDRLFFLKRLNLPVARPNSGDQASGGGSLPPASALNLPVGSPKFQLPIPRAELNANPNMQPNP